MKRFYIFRHGYNTANNPSRDGGPEAVKVAEVEAETAEEACQLARDSGVSCYHNQFLFASEAEAEDAMGTAQSQRVRQFRD